MNKHSLLIISFVISFLTSNAQINLVHNPSFEKFHLCPNDMDQIIFAYSWSPIHDTVPFSYDSLASGSGSCSPEYCNTCGIGIGALPDNGKGFHYPRTGNGVASVQMYSDFGNLDTNIYSYLRDYLQGRLYSRLIAGKSYCVSFYVVIE